MFSKKMMITVLLSLALSVFFAGMAFSAPKYTIKVGTIVSETHPDYITLRDVFKKKIEANSKGAIKVELYPNGQLGSDREMIESLQLGTLTMALPSSSALAGFEKKFQVLDLPYLFKSKAVAYKALDGELGKTLDALLPKHGMVNLGYFENGFRHVTNNRKPIHVPADMKGLKIRTQENPMHIAFFKQIGANPTPMNYGEVYTALQQGTIDAQENPIAIVFDGKFFEVQKFYSLTGHVFSAIMLVANKPFMDKLPKDMHAIVMKAAKDFVVENRKAVDKVEGTALATMKKAGLKVNTLTAAEKDQFIKAAVPIYSQFEGVLGKDLIEMAKKANN